MMMMMMMMMMMLLRGGVERCQLELKGAEGGY